MKVLKQQKVLEWHIALFKLANTRRQIVQSPENAGRHAGLHSLRMPWPVTACPQHRRTAILNVFFVCIWLLQQNFFHLLVASYLLTVCLFSLMPSNVQHISVKAMRKRRICWLTASSTMQSGWSGGSEHKMLHLCVCLYMQPACVGWCVSCLTSIPNFDATHTIIYINVYIFTHPRAYVFIAIIACTTSRCFPIQGPTRLPTKPRLCLRPTTN